VMLWMLPLHSFAVEEVHVSAKNAIIMEADSGRIIFEKDAYEQKPIASITKIMTALVALEEGNLQDEVTISDTATNTYGSAIYLKAKEKWSLEDLLYGLMLRSGNDAAIAIAEHVGGSEEGFVFMMNEKASKLGMNSTHFMNAHGLHEEDHYSTAYDMAILMQEAMKNEQFQQISSTKQYKAKNHPYPWNNKNKLLTRLYPHITGGKTGFTKISGRTFDSTASQDDVNYVAVTLNAEDDWNDHIQMYEHAFTTYKRVILAKKGKITFEKNEESIEAKITDHYYYPIKENEKDKLHQQIVWKKRDAEDEAILTYLLDGETIKEIPLQIKTKENASWIRRLFEQFLSLFGVGSHG